MAHTLNKTENGIIYRCSSCSKLHFEYKNLSFHFTHKQYYIFSRYFQNLSDKLEETPVEQDKFLIPTGLSNMRMSFKRVEIEELRRLFTEFPADETHSAAVIDFAICSN